MSTRAVVQVYMGDDFKQWLTEFAKRHDKSVSDVVMEELIALKKFDNFMSTDDAITYAFDNIRRQIGLIPKEDLK